MERDASAGDEVPRAGAGAAVAQPGTAVVSGSTERAMQCPWCGRWAVKDLACNWVCCGLARDADGRERFHVGLGCGRQWCFRCGLRLCSPMFDEKSGVRLPSAPTHHGYACCAAEAAALGKRPQDAYCPGGHDSHSDKRW